MWIDILLAIVALVGVLYGLAGEPKRGGKLTRAGKGVIAVAALALLLTIAKSVADQRSSDEQKSTLQQVEIELKENKSNTDRIPQLEAELDRLHQQASFVTSSTATASAEVASLKAAILATFESIRVENDRLIVEMPSEQIIKRKVLGRTIKVSVPVDKGRAVKEVYKFQDGMDRLESDLLGKVRRIEQLFYPNHNRGIELRCRTKVA